jgi:hypothetical protein
MSVYHGSDKKFKIAHPSPTKRIHMENGKRIVDYEGISLHSTFTKWIALAYTGKRIKYVDKGKIQYFNFGVHLKSKNNKLFIHKNVIISGKRSLEYSLNKLYGDGGYLYTFNGNKFKWVKGLGENEVISYDAQVPTKIEYIKNPVKEMKKLGVTFMFINTINNKNLLIK